MDDGRDFLKLRQGSAEENLTTPVKPECKQAGGRMEVFRFSIISTEEFEKREDFRKSVNCCPQCDHAMEFSYQQDQQFAVLQEEAHCPFCLYKQETGRHRVN